MLFLISHFKNFNGLLAILTIILGKFWANSIINVIAVTNTILNWNCLYRFDSIQSEAYANLAMKWNILIRESL